MVRCRTKIVDIGTDHGYLPAFLVLENKADSVLACDIGVLPLKNAENTVNQLKLNDRISLRVSDGLKEVSPDEAEEIIICGMGGTLISEILSAAPWIKRKGTHLILQPMTHTEDVRKYLCENGFIISQEKFVIDNKKVYCCISADYTGEESVSDEGFYHFGFLPPTDEIHRQYVSKQLKRVDIKIDARKNCSPDSDELKYFQNIRKYYDERMSE